MVKYEEKWGAKTEPVTVVVYTDRYRIEGTMFRLPKLRVTDAINQAASFLALKDATVYPLEADTPLMTRPFVAIHKHQIVFMTERE
jgi:hypothetical protein